MTVDRVKINLWVLVKQKYENNSAIQAEVRPVDNTHKLSSRYAAASGFDPLAKTNATKPALEAGEYAWGVAVSFNIRPHDSIKDCNELSVGEGYDRETVALAVKDKHVALLSAAPDLLEALETLVAPYDGNVDGAPTSIKLARQAIIKAKGTK